MRLHLFCVAALWALGAWAELSPEAQLCLTHLRAGERARLEKALGPVEKLPLYRAQLSVDPTRREVKGRVFITYVAKDRRLEALLLRLTPNAAHEGAVQLAEATAQGRPAMLELVEPTLYRVELQPSVEPGAAAQVELSLTAQVPKAPAGSDQVSLSLHGQGGDYGAFAASPEMMSLVGLLPAVPPSGPDGDPLAGPSGTGDLGLFEPSSWLVTVTVPTGYQVLASGNALGEVPEKGRKVRFTYGAAAARDFPIFVAKGLSHAAAKVDDVTVESYFLDTEASAGKKALRHAAEALGQMQKRFGPYPWTHLRVVQTRLGGGAGGMEFPGLVTVSGALYRGTADPFAAMGMPGLGAMLGGAMMQELFPNMRQLFEVTVEFTVAHEVAHQYFPMLVGSDPVGSPVTDEALAQYAALLHIEWKHGAKAAESLRKQYLVGTYHLHRMMGGEDGAADRPTAEFSSTTEYAALVYGKAPLFFHQARGVLGEEAFLRGLRLYVDENRYGWVDSEAVVRSLSRQGSGAKLEALRRRWWEEARGDEDLGKPDLAGMFGGGNLPKLDPRSMKLLEEMLRQLGGE
ncbi:MAG: M1 family aminopeptidase [Myxococcota bacterium]